MRRATTIIGISFISVLMTAGTVLAQTSETNQSDGIDVAGVGGSTATTGGDFSFALIAVAVLFFVGLLTLFLARRSSLRLDVERDRS
jgi:hypothetical protein